MRRQRFEFPRARFYLFLAVAVCLPTLLVSRIVDIQVLRGMSFRVLADENRFFTLPIDADRGVILDRYQEPLVHNTRRYFQVLNPDALHHKLQPVPREEALKIEATQSAMVINQQVRNYRFPLALAHLLGYVGEVTADDLSKNKQLKPSDRVGKLGLELIFDQVLRGMKGWERYEINALAQRQKIVETHPAVTGQNLQTTIDPYLSQVALEALGKERGAVVILDADTGNVLSLVSSPSFDPNALTKVVDNPALEAERQQRVKEMLADPSQLFFNRAVNGQYPPGSIFKLVTALAGFETGKIDTSTTVVDEGVLKVGEYQYGNWYYRQYGRTEGVVNITRALARSNDIYFYKVAEWVGPDAIASMARLFGLGEPTGIGLVPESKGLVPDPAWKESTIGERWYLGNTYHYGIGQGDVLVSPVQMAQLVQSIANKGTLCPPRILHATTTQCRELSIEEEHVEEVLKGMLEACSSGGTGFPFFAYNEAHRREGNSVMQDLQQGAVACKTGTAEFGGADAQGHRNTHGWFVAVKDFNQKNLGENSVSIEGSETATSSASLHQAWVERINKQPLPTHLVFVALVESSEEKPFKEGSADAGPVVKQIIDWMESGVQNNVTVEASAR
jgi:penicillin-binding protein 2